jgi:GntR family transcriptional regulator, transcriptional repressor for pyruvate dehydrogenase complex
MMPAMSTPWRPVGTRRTLQQRVADEIRRLIDSRHLRPGDRLPPERELARALGVGRSSLREAVAALTAQGVLRVTRGHGVYVAEPQAATQAPIPSVSTADLRQLFDMRAVLEVAAAGWAAGAATDEDLAALDATLAALRAEALADPPDLERLQELDTDFHLLIAAIARNRFLARSTALLHQMLAAGMETTLARPGRVRRSHQSHVRLAAAIASHDAAAAQDAMREHIAEVRATALDAEPYAT